MLSIEQTPIYSAKMPKCREPMQVAAAQAAMSRAHMFKGTQYGLSAHLVSSCLSDQQGTHLQDYL